jgi:hypothetical protein
MKFYLFGQMDCHSEEDLAKAKTITNNLLLQIQNALDAWATAAEES